MGIEPSAGLRQKSFGLRGDWIASITNVVIFLFICLQGLASSSAITANASNVLPYLAGRIGPMGFADLVALAVIASFATTIQSQIVDGSRIMFGMGRDRTVPKALGRVNPRFRTPVAGLIVMGVIPVLALILYLASGSLQKTIIYIDSTGGLLFAGYYVVISLYSIWYYRIVLFLGWRAAWARGSARAARWVPRPRWRSWPRRWAWLCRVRPCCPPGSRGHRNWRRRPGSGSWKWFGRRCGLLCF